MTRTGRSQIRRYAAVSGFAFLVAGLASSPAAAEHKALVQGVENRFLREEIERAVGESRQPSQTRIEARRRARDAQDAAELLLRSEGFYDYSIETDIAEGDHPQGVIRITLGPRTHFGPINIDWIGVAPNEEAMKGAFDSIEIRQGASARAEDVVETQGRIITALENHGYADAKAEPPDVVVDHADTSMKPTFRIDPGGLVHIGEVKLVRAKGRTAPKFIRKLAPWKLGEVYQPKSVAELERRLLDTGVYDSVTVSLEPKSDASPDALRPVLVNLAERSKHALDFTAGYSTNEGGDFDIRWSDFNRFHRADTLTYFGKLSANFGSQTATDDRGGVEWSAPHFLSPGQTLKLTGDWFRTVTPAYTEHGPQISADLTRRFQTTSFLTEGASITSSEVKDVKTGTVRIVTVRLIGAVALDHSDNPLDPRRGWKFEAHVTPTDIQGDVSLLYLKSQAQLTGYLPLDKKADYVLAGRAQVGSILGGTIPGLPAADRFFAGGGGSVRGYAYQSIGPHYTDNTPIGGLSLTELSLELRRRFGTSPFGAVVFVDAGSVSSVSTPDLGNLYASVGVGFRYHLSFAPIRADLAFPLQRPSGASQQPFQIYLSIGQSF